MKKHTFDAKSELVDSAAAGNAQNALGKDQLKNFCVSLSLFVETIFLKKNIVWNTKK